MIHNDVPHFMGKDPQTDLINGKIHGFGSNGIKGNIAYSPAIFLHIDRMDPTHVRIDVNRKVETSGTHLQDLPHLSDNDINLGPNLVFHGYHSPSSQEMPQRPAQIKIIIKFLKNLRAVIDEGYLVSSQLIGQKGTGKTENKQTTSKKKERSFYEGK